MQVLLVYQISFQAGDRLYDQGFFLFHSKLGFMTFQAAKAYEQKLSR